MNDDSIYASIVLLCSCDDAIYVMSQYASLTMNGLINLQHAGIYMCLKPLQVITFGYRHV